MTLIISGNETTGQSAGTDDLIVTTTGSVIVETGIGVSVSNSINVDADLSIFGTVISEGIRSAAVFAGYYVDGAEIDVGATANIVAKGGGSEGIYGSYSASNLIVNHAGFVKAADFGMYVGGVNSIVNIAITGTVIGGSEEGDDREDFSAAVGVAGDNSILNNAGTIFAEENVVTGRSLAVINSRFDTEVGFPSGVNETDDLDLIFNNSGDVFGEVLVAAGEDTLNNSGYISGRVDMGADDDVYNGRGGVVDDRILLGDGNDEGIGGSDSDVIEGGGDNDTIKGRTGDDALEGGGGADELHGGGDDDALSGDGSGDLLRGNSGDDTLQGGSGGDTLGGGSGDDDLLGGNGSDNLHGGSGDDDLRGGSGSDTISGGSGADTLDGGSSSDQLTGGGGRDVFVFTSPGHSPDNSNRDEITDFTVGQDKLDLSAMANFSFIGTSAFSGGGDAEVRATVSSSGNVSVRIDVDGDGSSDSRIVLTDVDGTLSAADFIF